MLFPNITKQDQSKRTTYILLHLTVLCQGNPYYRKIELIILKTSIMDQDIIKCKIGQAKFSILIHVIYPGSIPYTVLKPKLCQEI